MPGMGTARDDEHSGPVSAFPVAGHAALGHALGLLSIGALVAVFAAVEGPNVVTLGIGVVAGLLVVLSDRVVPSNSTFRAVRDAEERIAPVRVIEDRWWTGLAAWTSTVGFVLVLAIPVSQIFGDGAPQVAVGALVVGVARLVSWFAIRRLERARDGVAMELAPDDLDAEKTVVLHRTLDAGAAFGR